METTLLYAALCLGGAGSLAALVALGRASAARAAAADAEREARRRADNAGDEAKREIATLRQLLAVVASGGKLTREQVLEGRLWADVSPEEGKRLVESSAVRLLDVRTPGETSGGIIPGAVLIPVDQLEARLRELPKEGKRLLVYCAGGGRSAAACEFLSQQGFNDLANLEGGFGAWSGPRARP
jgi:phage shock protein E